MGSLSLKSLITSTLPINSPFAGGNCYPPDSIPYLTPPTAHLQEDRARSRWGKNWSGVPILLRDPKFQSIFSQHGPRALFQPWNPPGWGLDTPYIFLFLNHASNLMYTYFREVFLQGVFLLPSLSNFHFPHPWAAFRSGPGPHRLLAPGCPASSPRKEAGKLLPPLAWPHSSMSKLGCLEINI